MIKLSVVAHKSKAAYFSDLMQYMSHLSSEVKQEIMHYATTLYQRYLKIHTSYLARLKNEDINIPECDYAVGTGIIIDEPELNKLYDKENIKQALTPEYTFLLKQLRTFLNNNLALSNGQKEPILLITKAGFDLVCHNPTQEEITTTEEKLEHAINKAFPLTPKIPEKLSLFHGSKKTKKEGRPPLAAAGQAAVAEPPMRRDEVDDQIEAWIEASLGCAATPA